MTDFIENPTNIERLKADRVSLVHGTIQIRLSFKDRQEEVILNL